MHSNGHFIAAKYVAGQKILNKKKKNPVVVNYG